MPIEVWLMHWNYQNCNVMAKHDRVTYAQLNGTGPQHMLGVGSVYRHKQKWLLCEIWGDEYEDGSSKLPWNIGQYLPDYRALHPRRQPSWKVTICFSGRCFVRRCKVCVMVTWHHRPLRKYLTSGILFHVSFTRVYERTAQRISSVEGTILYEFKHQIWASSSSHYTCKLNMKLYTEYPYSTHRNSLGKMSTATSVQLSARKMLSLLLIHNVI
jgi:hypothetical protein